MPEDKPQTLAQCFEWLEHNLTEKQIQELADLTKDELWQTHYSIDKIVEKSLLAGNQNLTTHLDKTAFCDDPDLASQIVMAFWDHLQMQKSSG